MMDFEDKLEMSSIIEEAIVKAFKHIRENEKGKSPRPETEQDVDDTIRIFCGRSGRNDAVGAVRTIFDIDTSKLDKGREELDRLRNELHGIRRAAERAEHRAAKEQKCNAIYDHLTERISYIDPETAKIRKHNHDTLWAVLAGFTACAVLMVVFGLIIIGILFYARV